MNLSVIIPCYNAASSIGTQLEALAAQRWSRDWEVIVADNGSTDNTRAVVERYKGLLPNLRIIDASAKRGPAHARNLGAFAAYGEYVVFIDADDEVSSGWLEAIGRALAKHDFVCSARESEKLNSFWIQKTRKWTPPADKLRRARFYPHMPYSGGCGLGIKRSLFEAVGGFDESLPVLEDADFCFRVQRMGAELQLVPQAIIHIRHRDKISAMFQQARKWSKYQVLIYKRHRVPEKKFPHPWRVYLNQWKIFLYDLTHIKGKEDLAKCMFLLGWQLGLLEGSMRFRVPPVMLSLLGSLSIASMVFS